MGLRELRQNASELVRRVESGETMTVTVSGRAAARLVPVADRSWRRYDQVVDVLSLPADPDLQRELQGLDHGLVDPFDRADA